MFEVPEDLWRVYVNFLYQHCTGYSCNGKDTVAHLNSCGRCNEEFSSWLKSGCPSIVFPREMSCLARFSAS